MWFCFLLFFFGLHGIEVSPEPISVFYTPDSILQNPPNRAILVGKRSRLATCSDVRWSPESSFLIAAGVLDETLWTYTLSNGKLHPIHRFSSKEGLSLKEPEKLTFSPDGTLIAISGNGSAAIFPLKEGQIIPQRIQTFWNETGGVIHDVAFSPDANYFIHVTIDNPGRLELYRKEENYKRIQTIFYQKTIRKPKAILFSPDSRFLVIGFSFNAGKRTKETDSLLAVYPFDPVKGKIDETPISQTTWNGWVEAIAFAPDFSSIFSTDQNGDRVFSHPFDPTTGTLGAPRVVLKNPEAQLSFPHGLSFSPDGKYLTVSNYGDDKITIYEVRPSIPKQPQKLVSGNAKASKDACKVLSVSSVLSVVYNFFTTRSEASLESTEDTEKTLQVSWKASGIR